MPCLVVPFSTHALQGMQLKFVRVVHAHATRSFATLKSGKRHAAPENGTDLDACLELIPDNIQSSEQQHSGIGMSAASHSG